jgi:predicted RNA-binding protein YlxR (DUF448 family)
VFDQAALRRYVLDDGRVVRDDERARPGRGAYTCSEECEKRATERRGWARAFRAAVRQTPE